MRFYRLSVVRLPVAMLLAGLLLALSSCESGEKSLIDITVNASGTALGAMQLRVKGTVGTWPVNVFQPSVPQQLEFPVHVKVRLAESMGGHFVLEVTAVDGNQVAVGWARTEGDHAPGAATSVEVSLGEVPMDAGVDSSPPDVTPADSGGLDLPPVEPDASPRPDGPPPTCEPACQAPLTCNTGVSPPRCDCAGEVCAAPLTCNAGASPRPRCDCGGELCLAPLSCNGQVAPARCDCGGQVCLDGQECKDGKCQCLADGAGCGDSAACCSKLCCDGKCAKECCLSEGNKCEAGGRPCCGGLSCCDGTCSASCCAKQGQLCESSAGCCTGVCSVELVGDPPARRCIECYQSGGECRGGGCCGGLSCTRGTGGKEFCCQGQKEACDASHGCCSLGQVDANLRCGDSGAAKGLCCLAGGASCDGNDLCCKGGCCRDGTCGIAQGQSGCDSQNPCCDGLSCVGGRCCKMVGAACMAAADCCTGGCSGANRCCVPTGNSGCSGDADCCGYAPGGAVLCYNGQCCSVPGGSCGDASQCCGASDCQATAAAGKRCCRLGGQVCETAGECCGGGCQRPPVGGTTQCCVADLRSGCASAADCCSSGLPCTGGSCCLPLRARCSLDKNRCCDSASCESVGNYSVCCRGFGGDCTPGGTDCCPGTSCGGDSRCCYSYGAVCPAAGQPGCCSGSACKNVIGPSGQPPRCCWPNRVTGCSGGGACCEANAGVTCQSNLDMCCTFGTCTKDDQCCTGYQCDPNGRCTSCRETKCDLDGDCVAAGCAGHRCWKGTCRPEKCSENFCASPGQQECPSWCGACSYPGTYSCLEL